MGEEGGCGCAEVFEGEELGPGLGGVIGRALTAGSSSKHSTLNSQLRYQAQINSSMSLVHASQRVLSRGTCLRSSYLEISRFFRTRRHGITLSYAATCSQHGVRYFSGSRSLKELIEPDEKLKRTLEEFKATSMFPSPLSTPMLT
jgi:hypothetical protein